MTRKRHERTGDLDSDRFFVKTLTLENFRCFEKAKLGPFDPHFNLLVGTNGTGKSSVLLALANLFRQVANLPAGIAMGPLVGDRDVRVDHRDKVDKLKHEATPNRGEISSSYEWGARSFVYSERFGDERGNIKQELLKPSLEQTAGVPIDLSWPDVERAYPLIVRFTTNRRFQWPASIGDRAPDSSSVDRWSAFRAWTNAGASADELRLWMRDQTLIALQTVAGTPAFASSQLTLVQQACRASVEGATKIEFVGSQKDIVVSFEDGRVLDFSNMSDGQRALVGMVAEIARRACLLNSSYLEERVLTETPGLVLIDELDLHLHPRWQRRVIGDLKRIFPKIQFFATTHSPQVIGEARPEEIVLLTPTGEQKRAPQSYGMDSNWVLECVMEAEGRDPTVAKEIAHLYDEIEDGKFEEARARIAYLRKEIGGFGDVEAAESYMWRVEHEGDEAAE
jgi:energy-coupling factor transporter ATP-binding protein EcfA2